jgi:hypothetical protein
MLTGALTEELLGAVLRLLTYSWKDINFEYDALTEDEKKCLTREQHAQLVMWLKNN